MAKAVPAVREAEAISRGDKGGSPLAKLAAVGVSYGPRWALSGVSLRVAPGERIGVMGASGAGKTTLLRVLAGLVLPSRGSATVLGESTRELGRRRSRALRRRIGFVHQDLALVDALRVVHNVNAGQLGRWSTVAALASLARPRGVQSAHAALERVGIADKLWSRTDQLSGGQRQRVAIARTLVQDPDLVLADEPAANLDPPRAREVVRLLVEATAGAERALVISLHDPQLALEVCQRVIGIRQGRVSFDLPVEDVDAQLFDELYARDGQHA